MTTWQMPVAEISGVFPPDVPADAIAMCIDGDDLSSGLALRVGKRCEVWCRTCTELHAEVVLIRGRIYATTGPAWRRPLREQEWCLADPVGLWPGEECDRCGAVAVRDIAGQDWWANR